MVIMPGSSPTTKKARINVRALSLSIVSIDSLSVEASDDTGDDTEYLNFFIL